MTTFLQQQITDVPWIAVFLAFVVVALFAFRFQLRLRCEVVRRKQVEIEATEERNRLNAILSNAGVGIMLADRYARHVDVNRRWCRIFGYQRSEGFLSLTDMLDRKIKAVQTKGLIYIDAITGKSKI